MDTPTPPLVLPLAAAVTAVATAGVLLFGGVPGTSHPPATSPVAADGSPPAAVGSRPLDKAPARPGRYPDPGQVFVGITTSTGPYDLRPLDEYTAAIGKHPDLLMFSQDWARDTFRPEPLDRVWRRGLLPMVAWEPWDHAAPGKAAQDRGVQPKYALDGIIAGRFDRYIFDWAHGVRRFGHPVAIRFAHEMNGRWYPWDEGVNGNRPGQYAAAWRHVHDIFASAGATNVIWVWSPNRAFPGSLPLRELYPGDRYVDWVGVVGYFGGPGGWRRGYPTFDELFQPTLREIRSFTHRPVVITETGGTEVGGHKAEFIRAYFAGLRRHPEIIGFVWFEVNKETDWRVVSSPAVRAAYAVGIADKRYGAAGAGARAP